MNRKNKKAMGIFKANASEQMSMYPILRRFSAEVANVKDGMKPHCECFAALCDLADALNAAKFGRYVDRQSMYDELMFCIERFLTISSQLYGEAHTKPKSHVLFHIARDFLLTGLIPDCFPLERYNLVPKKHAAHILKTANFVSQGL